MSCHSCGGCFTGAGCSTAKLSKKDILSDAAKFQSLIDLAATTSQNDKQGDDHDHVIPTIMSQLSKNVYSSQTVLFKAFDELDLTTFLSLSTQLYHSDIVGVHIAWAAEYCKGDINELLRILNGDDEQLRTALFEHCDDQAEIHEMFGNLNPGSVGRVNKQKK